MAPKKPGKEILSEDSWRTTIENANLDEENWKVKVILIEAAGSDQDRIYLNRFEIFSAEEKRFVIKNICKTETIFMINQLGGEKKVKDGNLRVFEEGQAFLKNKQDIPPEVLALIIKHLILKMKEDNLFIRRQRLEVKQGINRESATMIDRAEVRGSVNVKPPEPDPPPAPPKGKKEKLDNTIPLPEPDEGKKYNTVLRVRGEEWRDRVYVDDFPVDGPHLYVAVTGFVEPLLASCLIKIGIPLTAVVQIRIDPVDGILPSSLLRATKRGQSQTELLADMSFKFWEDIQLQRISKTVEDDFKNTAFIVFTPPYWNKDTLSGNPEKIYDELSFLMYDVQDLDRQHANYLANMDIINIPTDKKSDSFYRHYKHHIAELPLECVTVYSVVDSLLQTIFNDKQSSETSLSVANINEPPTLQHHKSLAEDEKIEKAEALVKTVFQSLCKTDVNKKAYRSTFGEEYETHKDPIVINYGDFAKYNTFHLGNINLDNIVQSSLYCMPINKLWQLQNRPYGEHEAKINFHVNLLLSCFEREDVETTELKRLLHILSCRKLYNNRSSLKKHHLPTSTLTDFKKIYLKRSVLAEPLSRIPSITRSASSAVPSLFPSMTKYENDSDSSQDEDPETKRIKDLFDCPDIRELVSATEIANGKPLKHLIDDFEYFEDFFGISALQVMTDAFNKFNCVDYKYCEVTDCFVLMFFNSYDMDGIAREEWRSHLPTPVCLQDFFDFDLEENYDWIKNEELIYDEKEDFKIQSLSKVNIHQNMQPSCVENLDVGSDLLMEGSLKYQDANLIEDLQSKESSITFVTKKTTISPAATEQSGRKHKSPVASTPKYMKRQSFIAPHDSNTSLNYIIKPFCGYDLGDRRVEVFGKDSTYFSRDGTRVKTLYTLVIPINVEYISLEVVPGNGYNEFWFHKALSEVSQDILDTCESFRITCKDQMIINIKKQTYQIPLPVLNASAPDAVKQKDDATEKSTNDQLFETDCYHSLIITWPNGLITETVHDIGLPEISHIKQYQTLPKTEEEMRCISLNGEVVIFKTNGNIDVLKPDGSLIKITQYSKIIVLPDIPAGLSEESLGKNKKGKKDEKKGKDKTNKASKASLNDEKPEKPLEVELVIEEFELIETSGLRQKWVNDNSIDIEKYVMRTATDYCLGEIFSKRMDGTNLLLNKDGVYLVTFPNGTRIITYCVVEDLEIFPEWTEEEKEFLDMLEESETPKSNRSTSPSVSQYNDIGDNSSYASSPKEEVEVEDKPRQRSDGYISIEVVYTIEHANFTTVTINKAKGEILVDSPNGTQVVAHTNNTFDITLDSSTNAKFNGENLRISYEACPECQSFTTCDIKVKYNELSSVSKDQQKWLTMKDSFCRKVIVNEEGNISLIDVACSEDTVPIGDEVIINEDETKVFDEKPSDNKSETSEISHGKCREMYLAKTVKFFVLQRELSCAELIHRSLLEHWQTEHRWQPWYSVNHYDTFGDNRRLLSILSPIHLTESEKWLMDSSLADKPKYLTYKDLKKDNGKGFYHWMRPYERFQSTPLKPANVLPPRLPRAYILRALEQQWSEPKRAKLKGAKELTVAILKYRNLMQQDLETLMLIPIQDPRPEEERQIDDVLQALAERIYKDLQLRLDGDVRSRAKPNITTKPLEAEDKSVEDEIEEEPDFAKELEEERESQVSAVEEVDAMRPSLKRYWRRRKEEYNEEQFYLYLLREGSVPPYFRNVLGGAIWWEMNDTAGEAVTKAERNKMKCICADKEAKGSQDDEIFM